MAAKEVRLTSIGERTENLFLTHHMYHKVMTETEARNPQSARRVEWRREARRPSKDEAQDADFKAPRTSLHRSEGTRIE